VPIDGVRLYKIDPLLSLDGCVAFGTYLPVRPLLFERRVFMSKARMPQSDTMNISYIIVVVVLFVASFLGLHASTRCLGVPPRS
jgi:hypothetical protein